MQRHGHRFADARNLHLHRAALDKLRREPERRGACLQLVESWLAQPEPAARRWLEEWRRMLADWPVEEIARVVLDETGGQTLRQCSPLGPLLAPRERWQLLAEINRALAEETPDTP